MGEGSRAAQPRSGHPSSSGVSRATSGTGGRARARIGPRTRPASPPALPPPLASSPAPAECWFPCGGGVWSPGPGRVFALSAFTARECVRGVQRSMVSVSRRETWLSSSLPVFLFFPSFLFFFFSPFLPSFLPSSLSFSLFLLCLKASAAGKWGSGNPGAAAPRPLLWRGVQ